MEHVPCSALTASEPDRAVDDGEGVHGGPLSRSAEPSRLLGMSPGVAIFPGWSAPPTTPAAGSGSPRHHAS